MDLLQAIRESWGWVGIAPVEVVGSTALGNLMIKDEQGRYWRLCPEGLSCEVIAQTREVLDEVSRDQAFLHDWYLQPMVEQAEEALGPLVPARPTTLLFHRCWVANTRRGMCGGSIILNKSGSAVI